MRSTSSSSTSSSSPTRSFPLFLVLLAALVLLSSVVAAQPLAPGAAAGVGTRTTNAKAKAKRQEPSSRFGRRKQAQQAAAAASAARKDFSSFLCPEASVACPVAGARGVKEDELTTLADWFKVGFECLDPKTELGSCGGCMSLNHGQDCTAIAHARDVGCNKGACVVYSCMDGFLIGRDGKTCIKKADHNNNNRARR